MKNKIRLIKSFLIFIAVVIIGLVLVISFVGEPFVPTWADIFGKSIKYDKVSDSVVFIDVGEGDATLIRSNGRFALIDTGENIDASLVKKLKREGVNGLDALILTHWHKDHIGGAISVLEEFTVLNIIVPKMPEQGSEYYGEADKIISKVKQNEKQIHLATVGMAINIGDFRISILHCDYSMEDENNRSVVLMANCRNKKFLLTGDCEEESEYEILKKKLNIKCDVLKVAHHGSESSSTSSFLSATSAKYAIISVGRNNAYEHPSENVINRFLKFKMKIVRTDANGNITFIVNEEELSVKAER